MWEDQSQEIPARTRPKVGFVSLGCPKNLVDSEVMMGLLHHNGAELTPRAEDAEIIVINTCSFIDSAKQESVNTILEMVQHKQQNGGKASRIVVAGCLVERYRDEIQKNIPEVDAVVGTGELEAILEAAGLRPDTAASQTNSPFNILPQNSLAHRAPSAVHQHSHPTESGAQLKSEQEPSTPYSLFPTPSPSRPDGDARQQQARLSRPPPDRPTAPLPAHLYTTPTPPILPPP